MKLDTLFINGKVYPMVAPGHMKEAIGFAQGRIAFVGTNCEASALTADEIVDLEGQTALPGLVDSHMHMYAYCQSKSYVDLSKVKSLEEMIRLLRVKAGCTPDGHWIRGFNFDEAKWIDPIRPSRSDLDRVSIKHPVAIKRCCLHTAVANSLALRMAGIEEVPEEVLNGIIEVDHKGVPNGVLREGAISLIEDIAPDPLLDDQTRDRVFSEVLREMSSKGITGIHTYAAEPWHYYESTGVYESLFQKGALPLRVHVSRDKLFTKTLLTQEQKNNPYRFVTQGSYKLFCDGSMGARSAALKRDYSDDPGNRGFLMCGEKAMTEKLVTALEMGLQPAIHAIGDRALEQTVSAIEAALAVLRERKGKAYDPREYSFRIIHAQLIDNDLVRRMSRLPVYIDVQPVFLKSDANFIAQRLGAERLKGAYAWQTMLNAGLILAGGSDCPVEVYDPLQGIHTAVNGCDDPSIGETVSVFDAIAMYTKNPYKAAEMEQVLGTLETGKFADMVVLGQDPFEVDPSRIEAISVQRTYVAGRLMYQA